MQDALAATQGEKDPTAPAKRLVEIELLTGRQAAQIVAGRTWEPCTRSFADEPPKLHFRLYMLTDDGHKIPLVQPLPATSTQTGEAPLPNKEPSQPR